MVLNPATLAAEIQKFTDRESPTFEGFPEDAAAAAHAWATAVDVYTSGGLGITPPSITGVVARAALEAGLVGMAAPGGAVVAFNLAFAAWSAAIVPGMLPAFVATPPPLLVALTPPTMAAVFAAGLAGADAATQALAMATLIHAWISTGSATPAGGGPPVPWS